MEVHQPPAYLYSNLGLIPFLDAMELEHKLTKLISDEKSHDVLLILQHPPTVTMGKFGKPENVLIPLSELGEKASLITIRTAEEMRHSIARGRLSFTR